MSVLNTRRYPDGRLFLVWSENGDVFAFNLETGELWVLD